VRAQSEGEGGAYRVVVFDLGMAMVPDFTLPNLDGEDVSSAQFENQVRIVDVWATWCPPCVQEIPHFMEIADEYRDRGVSVIGVSTGEDAATVRAFTEPRDVNYTILLDQDGQFANEMGPLTPEGSIQGIPTTFVIDQEGKIVSVHVGYTEKDVFTEEIDRLLAATD
jgi:peroxiredoxin